MPSSPSHTVTILRRMVAAAGCAALLASAGCGSAAPCEKAVDNKIALQKAEGSPAEKTMATQAETKPGLKEGLVKVCDKLVADNQARAAIITCEAQAANLAALKACVNARPQ